MERVEPHDLLRVRGPGTVHCGEPEAPLPQWAKASLRRAPWVVVRRARTPAANLIPVGVRGSTRGERQAAFLDSSSIIERLTPEDLLSASRGKSLVRTPALRALGELDQPLFGLSWGPTGSAGFELASGTPTTNSESDLDIVIRAPAPMALSSAVRLSKVLAALPVRVDAQLDTPSGAVSLQEYARGRKVLARSPEGPKIICSPWRTASLEMRAKGSTV